MGTDAHAALGGESQWQGMNEMPMVLLWRWLREGTVLVPASLAAGLLDLDKVFPSTEL